MKIAIVDYGMGNLHSVLKSVATVNDTHLLGLEIVLTDEPDVVFSADKIIFPGQGAMPDCMSSLQKSGLIYAVKDGLKNKPFLGICVGAQLLFDISAEGNTPGLSWFSGKVTKFPNPKTNTDQARLKIPHMGWNRVYQEKAHPLFHGIEQGAYFYFVHSYFFEPESENIVLATSQYPDKFACIVGKNNVFATQFHVEKSHDSGLKLIHNFLRWDGVA